MYHEVAYVYKAFYENGRLGWEQIRLEDRKTRVYYFRSSVNTSLSSFTLYAMRSGN